MSSNALSFESMAAFFESEHTRDIYISVCSRNSFSERFEVPVERSGFHNVWSVGRREVGFTEYGVSVEKE